MVEVLNYEDRRGREPLEDYLDRLERNGEKGAIATIIRYIELLEQHGAGLGMPQDRMIDRAERVWELRAGDHRIAYAVHGGAIVLLSAWRKQSRRLDGRELERARSRLADWRERH